MKTPEQIARQAMTGPRWAAVDPWGVWQEGREAALIGAIASAIEADRAQRADLLKREADTLGFYYRNAEDMTSPEGFIDKKGERYDQGDLMHNMARAREAMLLAIGVDATEAFREAFK